MNTKLMTISSLTSDKLPTLISIIIPVFNEEDNVEATYLDLKRVTADLRDYSFEFLFTDNHSSDQTFERLRAIAASDATVRVVRFARNFGFQKSVLAGYLLARGEAAIQIDADLQDPPTLFALFLDEWQKGSDVVVGVRKKRPENTFLSKCRKIYYRALTYLGGPHLIPDAGDFRLIDRSIIEKCRAIKEPHMYLRGLISSLARKQASVPYDRAERHHNESKFRLAALLHLALDGLVSHSTFLLKISFYTGILISVAAAILASYYIALHFWWPSIVPPGFTTTQTLILFGIGLNSLFLGLLGVYIGRIYDQVRPRPLVIVADLLNFDSDIQSVEREFLSNSAKPRVNISMR